MGNIVIGQPERIPSGIRPEDVYDAMQHAIESFPEECCGAFTVCGYRRLTNVADNRQEHFVIKERVAVVAMSHEIVALFHSHTTGNAWAGKDDMLMQIVSGKPHGICVVSKTSHGAVEADDLFFWGSANIPPLIGRKYRPNTMDCFSLARDAYWQWYGLKLPEVPRNPEDIEKGVPIFEAGIAAAGFREIPLSEAAPGDVLLGKILSSNFNHCALVIDNRHIIHHYRDRLSRRDELSQWAQMMKTCLRHTSFVGLPPLPPIIV